MRTYANETTNDKYEESTELILTVHTLYEGTELREANFSLQKEWRLLTVRKERGMVTIRIIPRLCCVQDPRIHFTILTWKSTLYT